MTEIRNDLNPHISGLGSEYLSLQPPAELPQAAFKTFADIPPANQIGPEEHLSRYGANHPLSIPVAGGDTLADVTREHPEFNPDEARELLAARLAGTVAPSELLLTGIIDDGHVDYRPYQFTPPPDSMPEDKDGEKLERPLLYPEVVSDDVNGAITNCAYANYWTTVGALSGRLWQRQPLHALRVVAENEDEEVTSVAWGGAFHGAEELDALNIRMLNKLAEKFGGDFAQDHQALGDIRLTSEDGSTTFISIRRLAVDHGWTVDVAEVKRVPHTKAEQNMLFERHQELYHGAGIVEEPSAQLAIWLCPPSKGLDTLYPAQSSKGHAEATIEEAAAKAAAWKKVGAALEEEETQPSDTNANAAVEPLPTVIVPRQRVVLSEHRKRRDTV